MLPTTVWFSCVEVYAVASARRVSMQTGSTGLLLAIKNLGEDSGQNAKFEEVINLLVASNANVKMRNEVRARDNCAALLFFVFLTSVDDTMCVQTQNKLALQTLFNILLHFAVWEHTTCVGCSERTQKYHETAY